MPAETSTTSESVTLAYLRSAYPAWNVRRTGGTWTATRTHGLSEMRAVETASGFPATPGTTAIGADLRELAGEIRLHEAWLAALTARHDAIEGVALAVGMGTVPDRGAAA